jgi:hypothetical protein
MSAAAPKVVVEESKSKAVVIVSKPSGGAGAKPIETERPGCIPSVAFLKTLQHVPSIVCVVSSEKIMIGNIALPTTRETRLLAAASHASTSHGCVHGLDWKSEYRLRFFREATMPIVDKTAAEIEEIGKQEDSSMIQYKFKDLTTAELYLFAVAYPVTFHGKGEDGNHFVGGQMASVAGDIVRELARRGNPACDLAEWKWMFSASYKEAVGNLWKFVRVTVPEVKFSSADETKFKNMLMSMSQTLSRKNITVLGKRGIESIRKKMSDTFIPADEFAKGLVRCVQIENAIRCEFDELMSRATYMDHPSFFEH